MKRYLVERELIQNNIQVLQKKAGSAVIWAVLKGNGYGLGLLPMAETCRAAGLDHFAVTEIAEARALREGGFETEPILMLQPTADADEITALLPLHVIFTISSTEDASVLAGLAAQAGGLFRGAGCIRTVRRTGIPPGLRRDPPLRERGTVAAVPGGVQAGPPPRGHWRHPAAMRAGHVPGVHALLRHP